MNTGQSHQTERSGSNILTVRGYAVGYSGTKRSNQLDSDCNYHYDDPGNGVSHNHLLPQFSPQTIAETGWKGINLGFPYSDFSL